MSEQQTLTPPVLWAQREDRLLLTIDLQDVKEPKVKLTPAGLSFSGTSQGKLYSLDLEFLKEIKPEESRWGVLPRHVQLNIIKNEPGPYWDRLLKESGKHWFLKCDWDRWVDEDDDDTAGKGDFNLGDLDMGGDFPYDDAEDEDEDDDDDLPDLEEDKPAGESAEGSEPPAPSDASQGQ